MSVEPVSKIEGPAPRVGSADLLGALPHLPDEYTCDGCGERAADFACIRTRDEIDASDRAYLDTAGRWEGEQLIEAPDGLYTNGVEIEVCGCCGSVHWSAPNHKMRNAPSIEP